ncbi:TPA: HIRAN domain-containing protein, partial [Streptococcus suis]|nr:HIRAN domain-containing protein [Streptococcus suis]
MTFTSFEPTRNVQDFHLAAFAYYDGLDVIDQLKPGTPVQLVGEPSNPHDSEAVA